MEAYMITKTIENQKIHTQILLHQMKDARDILIQSMKKRKDMAMQSNEFNVKEEDSTRLFDNGNPSECVVAIADLMETNNSLKEQITCLKREHEIQVVRLFEETKLRKKVVEEKFMIKDDTRILTS